jgi:DNA polymerase-3 subunit beta
LDHSIIEIVNAEVDTFGMAVIPAHAFGDIIRKAQDEFTLEFSLSEKGSRLVIVAGKSRFELASMNPSDFPEVLALKNNCNINIKVEALNKLINRTRFSMSPEGNRYNLSGIYIHKEDAKLKSASTDGHRLSTCQIDIEAKENIQGVIISRKTVFELKKMLDIFEGEVQITFSANQIQFVFGEVVLISKLVDGVFPDYKKVIPDMNADFFRVKRSDFADVIERVSVVSDDKVRSVKLELNKGSLLVYVPSSGIGSGRDEIDVSYSGQTWSSGFNAGYLTDVAQAVEGDTLKVFVRDSISPILIMDEDDVDSLFVVMPMRI